MTDSWCWLCRWPEEPCPYNCWEAINRIKNEPQQADLYPQPKNANAPSRQD